MKAFVDFKTYNESNPFGAYDAQFYPSTHHHIGSDFKVPIGTPITAPKDGQMLKVMWSNAKGNVGIFLFSHEGIEWGLELCHLKEFPKLGQYKEGAVMAYSGNTGTATTAPHLHVVLHRDALVTKNYADLINETAFFKLRDQGRIVDPYAWFKGRITQTT